MRTCSDLDMADLHSDAQQEAQANVFASELLLPAALCRPVIEGAEPSIDLAKFVANQFNVGLIASALRVLELSAEGCALLFVEPKGVRWFRRNEHFRGWLNVLGPPHRSSLAARLLRGSTSADADVADVGCWLDDARKLPEDSELTEYAVPMPNLGGALVLLHLSGCEPED